MEQFLSLFTKAMPELLPLMPDIIKAVETAQKVEAIVAKYAPPTAATDQPAQG